MEKQHHAQKKTRIDMQQENQPGDPVRCALCVLFCSTPLS
jgi:hypothetical protein